jgi:hypothetical protein
MVLWGLETGITRVMPRTIHGKAYDGCQRGFALDKAAY